MCGKFRLFLEKERKGISSLTFSNGGGSHSSCRRTGIFPSLLRCPSPQGPCRTGCARMHSGMRSRRQKRVNGEPDCADSREKCKRKRSDAFSCGANEKRLRGHGVGVQCPSRFLSLSRRPIDTALSLQRASPFLSFSPSLALPLYSTRPPPSSRVSFTLRDDARNAGANPSSRGLPVRFVLFSSSTCSPRLPQLSARWSILIWDDASRRPTHCRRVRCDFIPISWTS